MPSLSNSFLQLPDSVMTRLLEEEIAPPRDAPKYCANVGDVVFSESIKIGEIIQMNSEKTMGFIIANLDSLGSAASVEYRVKRPKTFPASVSEAEPPLEYEDVPSPGLLIFKPNWFNV